MDPDEYRQHAAGCRAAAERATDPIRGDFLAAALIWDMLADQWEWLELFSGEADPENHRAANRR